MSEKTNSFITQIKIEKDMHVLNINETDGLPRRIFKKCPLIGDYVLSDKNLDVLFSDAKEYIDFRLSYEGLKRDKNSFNLDVHERISLAVVNYAKSWNSNEEGKFTRYIAKQFGYIDEYERVWNIITESLEIALNKNHRFFIYRNKDRQFYETVMSHSMGPQGSWFPLIDLLFSFYKDNLDWNYVSGDPLFIRFVIALQNHFNNESESDDNYLIASKTYNLKVGIRRLVQERPGYCVKLFEDIVRRIDDLLQNKAEKSKKYIYAIVDSWYRNILSNSERASETSAARLYRQRNTDIALNYSEISIKYTMDEDEVYVSIPDIRLLGYEKGDVYAEIYYEDKNINSISLAFSGNELGETIHGTRFLLPKDIFSKNDIRLRIIIKRGNNIIYDSAKKLWRSIILFSDGKEININRVNNKNYQLFTFNKNEITGKNIMVYDTDNPFIIDIFFDEGYKLKYFGKTLVMDISSVKGISISEPAIVENACYENEGNKLFITKDIPELQIYFENEEELKKYQIRINEDNINSLDYWNEESGRLEIIPDLVSNESVRFSVIDLSNGKRVFDNSYFYLDQFDYSFNQSCFITFNELEQGEIYLSYNGGTITDRLKGSYIYRRGLSNGQIVIDVPFVNCCIRNIDRVYYDKYIRFEEINKNTVLHIDNSFGNKMSLTIGDYYLDNFSKDINLYDVKNFFDYKTGEEVNITIGFDSIKRDIYQIIYKNAFVFNPVMGVKDNVFWWDGGVSYIGDDSAELSICLEGNQKKYVFPLVLGERTINVFKEKEFDDGDYVWSVYDGDLIICQGSDFMGDERKARFKNKTIWINKISGDIEDKKSVVFVKNVYIDQIDFVDTQYVETEGDYYDVYTGCMYWNRYDGKKYFSFKYSDKRYKVNPVKIIYINKRYLRIVNEDDEGLYCYNNKYSSDPGLEITDREPLKNYEDYSDILFYLYSVEGRNKKGLEKDKTAETKKIENNKSSNSENYSVSQGKENIIQKKTPDENIAEEPPKNILNDSYKKIKTEKKGLFDNITETTQDKIIKADVNKRILVNAGPGTGKTWTLIEKIIYMVKNLEIEAEKIQVICFSRAAVEVIEKRIDQEVETDTDNLDIKRIDVRTFDSFATQLLYWVRDSDYDIIPKEYQIEILNYEERIQKFIDVINSYPELVSECRHLVVDEVQDLVLSRADMVLSIIKNLPKDCGVTLFGDACQSIYDYQLGSNGKSLGFYREIDGLKEFKSYSFSENYRQTSKLTSYSDKYRKYILKEDALGCRTYLESLTEIIPNLKIDSLENIREKDLKKSFKNVNVAILTRNNAQALMLSGILKKHGVDHCTQRRLKYQYLCSWIALVLNEKAKQSYDYTEFYESLTEMGIDDVDEIWDFISDGDFERRIDTKAILLRIKKSGACHLLYSNGIQSKLTISTIHRSKGREYDSVILLDELFNDDTLDMEEHRVKYVALSRAKSEVYISSMKKIYFRTLENRRCFSVSKSFRTGNNYLSFFEIGLKDDLNIDYFVSAESLQEWIRNNIDNLIGKEVYLSRQEEKINGYIVYDVVLEEDNTIIGQTSKEFYWDLSQAIRRAKGLSASIGIYDHLYPDQFHDIYIKDVSSEIALMRGFEDGVEDFGGLTTWNTIQIEGYAKVIY